MRDFNIAIVTNDKDFILNNIADNIRWDIIGDSVIQGKEDFIEKLDEINKNKVTELSIYNIITHGYIASANGKV